MKTSGIIKLTGIICIVFGGLGLLQAIGTLLMPGYIEGIEEVAEFPLNFPGWYLMLAYIDIFVNVLYLVAGVIFLLKKRYSLILIYVALTISILYVVIPCIVVKPFDAMIFVLISPLIDIILLIAVYRIRKYYFKSSDKEIRLLGEYVFTPGQLKLFTFFGLLCMSLPLSIFGLWIYSSNAGTSQADSVAIFNSYFPDFLQGRFDTAYLSLAFCLLAIILCIVSLKLSGKFWKNINILVLIISSLLLFLNLFQMM